MLESRADSVSVQFEPYAVLSVPVDVHFNGAFLEPWGCITNRFFPFQCPQENISCVCDQFQCPQENISCVCDQFQCPQENISCVCDQFQCPQENISCV